jgi:hypothetical protein
MFLNQDKPLYRLLSSSYKEPLKFNSPPARKVLDILCLLTNNNLEQEI